MDPGLTLRGIDYTDKPMLKVDVSLTAPTDCNPPQPPCITSAFCHSNSFAGIFKEIKIIILIIEARAVVVSRL